MLSLSLLQGDMDHFVVAVVNAEKDWKEWYHNPFNTAMPKIEVESDRSSSKCPEKEYFNSNKVHNFNLVSISNLSF